MGLTKEGRLLMIKILDKKIKASGKEKSAVKLAKKLNIFKPK